MAVIEKFESIRSDESVLNAALRQFEKPSLEYINNQEYKYWFIYNPFANKGKASKKVQWLSDGLKKYGCDTVIQVTTERNEATHFSSLAKNNVEIIVACGGDGTLNEVIQPLVGSKTVLGCLPLGSANDFIKNISSNQEPAFHLSKLFKSKSIKVDLGKVTYSNGQGASSRYFINSFGLGFSGRVAKEAQQLTWAKGDLSYVVGVFKVASDYEPQKLKCKIYTPEGIIDFEDEVYMLSVGNGKVEAGKFNIAPNAKINDGLLDLCILKKISKSDLPKWIGKYMKGTHIQEQGVIYTQITKLEIDLPKSDVLHLDGEIIDQVHDKLTIEVCPSSLNVLTSNDPS